MSVFVSAGRQTGISALKSSLLSLGLAPSPPPGRNACNTAVHPHKFILGDNFFNGVFEIGRGLEYRLEEFYKSDVAMHGNRKLQISYRRAQYV
jgi:hypothetical protein